MCGRLGPGGNGGGVAIQVVMVTTLRPLRPFHVWQGRATQNTGHVVSDVGSSSN